MLYYKCAANFYKTKLNILKDCGTEGGCIPQITKGKYRYLNAYPSDWNWDKAKDVYKFITADGMAVFFGGAGIFADTNAEKNLTNGAEIFLNLVCMIMDFIPQAVKKTLVIRLTQQVLTAEVLAVHAKYCAKGR